VQNYRVLNCITGLNIGGAEYMLARFARSLSDTRFEAQVLSLMSPGPVSAILEGDGVRVETLNMKAARPSVMAFGRLRPAVRRSDCDIVHGWMYHGNMAASIGAYIDRRQPVVWSIHHSVDDVLDEKLLTRAIIGALARMSSRTAAISYCSRISADQHESLGFDPARRAVIPNGVDCDEFRPRPDARERLTAAFDIPGERMIIGNVARAHPMKNHEGFVRTLARLHQDGYDVHGLIVGDGHDNGAARQMARTLGIDDRLSTPGPRRDIAAFLSGLDIFLLSSAWGEAFPLSVAEAMASGVPVVVTDVGDCGWLVGSDDLVAKPRDSDTQAAIIRRILDLSHDERKALGLAGRARVAENFSIQLYTERHLQLYETALARSNGERSSDEHHTRAR
jgi:glycosyltransferase involved in cell wall biosynthesis